MTVNQPVRLNIERSQKRKNLVNFFFIYFFSISYVFNLYEDEFFYNEKVCLYW